MRTVSRQDLSARLRNGGPILVEALPAKYFNEGHLPGAININHDEIRVKATRLLPDKASEIVVYCASTTCTNSDKAAAQLESLGYQNVSVFKGGKADWVDAGLSLETQ